MVGISAACFDGETFLLHVHTGDSAADEAFFDYATSLGLSLKWFYAPLWSSESIIQVFVRWDPNYHLRPASLIVRLR